MKNCFVYLLPLLGCLISFSQNSYSTIVGSTESIVPSDFGIPDHCYDKYNKTLLEQIDSIDIGDNNNSDSDVTQHISIHMFLFEFQQSLQATIESQFADLEYSSFSSSFVHRIQREQPDNFETIGGVVNFHFLFKTMGFYQYFELPIIVSSRVDPKTCERTFIIENKKFLETTSWEHPTKSFEPWIKDSDAIRYMNERTYGN